jgi:hypothetical protein
MRYACLLVFAALLCLAADPPRKAPKGTHVLEVRERPTHLLVVSPDGKVTAEPFSEEVYPRWKGTWKQRDKSLTIVITSGTIRKNDKTKELNFRLDGGLWKGPGGILGL